MKKLYFLLLFISFTSFSQTTLTPGDIVITSLIADNNDRFEFIPLVDLEAGTVIYFTESGWIASTNSWRNDDLTEGVLQYTAPSMVTKGTVISVEEDATVEAQINLPIDGSLFLSDYGNNWGLSVSGDQIIAFQGTPPSPWDPVNDSNPFPSPNFIFAVTSHSTSWHDATATTNTAIPTGLIDGLTAVAAGSGPNDGDEWDNVYYDAVSNPLEGKSKNEILALVGNAANWIGNNDEADNTTGWKITSFTLGLKSISKSELSIYPNPVNNGFINIKSQISGEKNVELYDMLGRTVLQTTLSSDTLDVQSVKSGLYLLKVSIDDRSSTTKIIIQ